MAASAVADGAAAAAVAFAAAEAAAVSPGHLPAPLPADAVVVVDWLAAAPACTGIAGVDASVARRCGCRR